eukprot:1030521-Pleurochrysis_carterae.AAC.4
MIRGPLGGPLGGPGGGDRDTHTNEEHCITEVLGVDGGSRATARSVLMPVLVEGPSGLAPGRMGSGDKAATQ